MWFGAMWVVAWCDVWGGAVRCGAVRRGAARRGAARRGAENLIYVFDNSMAILEKLIQLNLLRRFAISGNLARFPPALMVLICVLFTLFEGDASEASGGRRLFKDRLFSMILVFFNDH